MINLFRETRVTVGGDGTSVRTVEVYYGGKQIRDRVNCDSYRKVLEFASAAADYLGIPSELHHEFGKWLYTRVTELADEADRQADEEAKQRALAMTAEAVEESAAGGRLGTGRPLQLPALDPWPEPVELRAALDEAVEHIRRFVHCTTEQAQAAALYSVFTFTFRYFDIVPYLIITSPTKRCGKTTFLRVLLDLVCRPIPAVNITPAAIYHVVDAVAPTLLIDEADTFIRSNPEIAGVVNSGWSRDMAYVIRCDPETGEPRTFSTFGPKVIAAIGRLRDTVEDRSLIIQLERRPRGCSILRYSKSGRAAGRAIASKFLAWAMDNQPALIQAAESEPDLPDVLHDRAHENWRPLVIIADLAGGDWPERARHAAVVISAGGDETDCADLSIRMLADIRNVLGGASEIAVSELHEKLISLEESPWGTIAHGRPLSVHRMVEILKAFGVKSIRRRNARVFTADRLAKLFERYLPTQTVTTVTHDVSHCQFKDLRRDDLSDDYFHENSNRHAVNHALDSTYDKCDDCDDLKRERDDDYEILTL